MSNLQLTKNLKTLRKIHQLTQTHISTLLNISRQAYSNYENGKRVPDIDTLINISQIYCISLDELVSQNIGNVFAKNKTPYLPGINIRTKDTLYLTDDEITHIFDYRDLSEENKKIITAFIKSQLKSNIGD
ncbi:helix-turn-helix domain-containing protein [Lachnospiraceae bacterium LCP25S3_G4]